MAIQFKRGTAASATSNNTTLEAGQPGFETDTGRFKIGDGSTAWNSLSYAAARPGAVTGGDLTMATARLLGRTTASTGAIEEISVSADDFTLTGGTLSLKTTIAFTGHTLSGGTLSGNVLIPAQPGTTTSGSAVSTDAAACNARVIAATDSFTLNAPTNPTNEQRIMFRISNGGSGTITVTPSGFILATGLSIPTLEPNETLRMEAIYNDDYGAWHILSALVFAEPQ